MTQIRPILLYGCLATEITGISLIDSAVSAPCNHSNLKGFIVHSKLNNRYIKQQTD